MKLTPTGMVLCMGMVRLFILTAGATTPAIPAPPPAQPSFHFNVRDFGAVGNGTTLDTVAIQNALAAAGNRVGGATVDIPNPGTYLSGNIRIPSNVWLNVETGAILQGTNPSVNYPLVTARWEGHDTLCYSALITAENATNIAVIGGGKINGGSSVSTKRNPRGPLLFEPRNCQGVYLQGVTVSNHGCWTLHPTFCQDVTISGVTIVSDGTNGDGIDPDSCARVLIENCSISAGDDCVAIKSGINQEGVTVGIPTEDVTIRNCNFVKIPQGAVALGSELSGGLRRILITNNTFNGGSHAIYIKSRAGRGGYCTDVTVDTNTFTGRVLEVTGVYTATAGTDPVAGIDGVTQFSNFTVTNVIMNSTTAAIASIAGDSQKPINGVVLTNFFGTSKGGINQSNSTYVKIANINVSGSGIAVTDTLIKQEIETLPFMGTSVGTTQAITTDTRYSSTMASQLYGTAVGNHITYQFPNVPAGTYNVWVGVKKQLSRGIWQLAVDSGGSFTGAQVNVGAPQDNYSATDVFTEVDLGLWTSSVGGNPSFRFTITGKNASSSGFTGVFDYITLIPKNVVAPVITLGNNGAVQLNLTASLAGYNYQLQRSYTLAADSWVSIGTAKAGGGALSFSDTRDSADQAAFYRLLIGP